LKKGIYFLGTKPPHSTYLLFCLEIFQNYFISKFSLNSSFLSFLRVEIQKSKTTFIIIHVKEMDVGIQQRMNDTEKWYGDAAEYWQVFINL